jgi:hypothetical protein
VDAHERRPWAATVRWREAGYARPSISATRSSTIARTASSGSGSSAEKWTEPRVVSSPGSRSPSAVTTSPLYGYAEEALPGVEPDERLAGVRERRDSVTRSLPDVRRQLRHDRPNPLERRPFVGIEALEELMDGTHLWISRHASVTPT